TAVVDRIRGQRWGGLTRALFLNAASLMGTTVVTSMLGYVFWIIAARTYRPADVGFAAAVISALTFLAMLAKVGLGTLLIGELRRYPGAELRLIGAAAAVAGVVGVTLGAGFAVSAPHLSAELEALAASPVAVLVFAVSVGVTALALVLDEAVVGLLRGGLQLARNVAMAVLKLAGLVLLAVIGGTIAARAIYLTWPVATALSLALMAYRLRDLRGRAATPGHRGPEDREREAATRLPFDRATAWRAVLHHAVNFLGQAAGLVMPVLVVSLVSVTAGAYLFVAYTIASLLTAVSSALTTALYATGAREPDALHRQLSMSLGAALLSAVAGIVGVLLLGNLVLSAFGEGYSAEAGPVLRILVLGAIPIAIKTHFGAIARIRNQLGRASIIFALGAALEIGLAGVGAQMAGLVGLATGWVIALWLEGLVLLVPVLREAWPPWRAPYGSRA
ncbi:MAG TPA: oligosaccharide flippase family protein, partial [Gemmatimonadales bacterium]|nr:oligosaccharide flippase family protein [Gemmatimonadales bacterium]